MDIPVKPRVLIADDSRIVRATLIKHIEGMFEFREALNGEEAWETLLLDPSIRVVITDLTMPKLDGYGLLRRIRSSKITRIREIPVVVVSGSDEKEERERAKAAGATDLITKGIGTAQLLSRLDILSRLVGTQHEFERSLEALVKSKPSEASMPLPSTDALQRHAEAALAGAVKYKKNFVVLNVCVGLRPDGLNDAVANPPASVLEAIGQLLKRTVRQTDHVARTGDAEFTLVTGSINFDAARSFAQRVCGAIANADLIKDSRASFVASCGLATLGETGIGTENPSFQAMQDLAHRRAMLGLNRAVTGMVGEEEEIAFQRNDIPLGGSNPGVPVANKESLDGGDKVPELATLLQWIREGRRDKVLPHMDKLSAELQPLVDLLLQQDKR